MTAAWSKNGLEHSRLMAHPGPVVPHRLERAGTHDARCARATLGEGQTLLAGLKKLADCLAGAEDTPAVFNLLRGHFATCVFCLAAPDETGHTVATYTPWARVSAVDVLGGSATFGRSVDDNPMVHCHAWFRCLDDGTIRGGHLDPAVTVIGDTGLVVMATQLAGISVYQTPDPETNHAVFMPLRAAT